MHNNINSNEFGNKIFNQFMNSFIIPEIQIRQNNKILPTPVKLKAAQIIFFPDGRKPVVRINSEVNALSKVRLKSGIAKKKNEPVFEHEIEGIEGFQLTNKDDLDCGHVTLMIINNIWTIAFDFRYNKVLSKKHIQAAKEFYDAAYYSYTQNHYIPAIDALFSCVELLAKARLLSIPDPKFMKKATHKAIQLRYNSFAKLGNVSPDIHNTFNKLYGLRDNIRYLKKDISISPSEVKELLDTVNKMFIEVSTYIEI